MNNNDLFVVFENKVKDNTILQDHELYDYVELAELYKKSKSFLVFLVPVNYQYKAQIESINKSKTVKDIQSQYIEDRKHCINLLEDDGTVDTLGNVFVNSIQF